MQKEYKYLLYNMSAQEMENRRGCNKNVILFFVFAICIIAAFLIIGLVKTCNAEHEEDNEIKEEQVIEQATGSLLSTQNFELLS